MAATLEPISTSPVPSEAPSSAAAPTVQAIPPLEALEGVYRMVQQQELERLKLEGDLRLMAVSMQRIEHIVNCLSDFEKTRYVADENSEEKPKTQSGTTNLTSSEVASRLSNLSERMASLLETVYSRERPLPQPRERSTSPRNKSPSRAQARIERALQDKKQREEREAVEADETSDRDQIDREEHDLRASILRNSETELLEVEEGDIRKTGVESEEETSWEDLTAFLSAELELQVSSVQKQAEEQDRTPNEQQKSTHDLENDDPAVNLRQQVTLSKPFLGFSLAEKSKSRKASSRPTTLAAPCLVIDSLYVNGPAHAVGLQLNDLVVSIGGELVQSLEQTRKVIGSRAKVGQTVEVVVRRKTSGEVAEDEDENDETKSVQSARSTTRSSRGPQEEDLTDSTFTLVVKTIGKDFSSLKELWFDTSVNEKLERKKNKKD